MKERLFNFVITRPYWVIALLVIMIAAAAAGAQHLVFKSDYRIFFSKDNPQLNAFESMQQIYSKSDNVAFVLTPAEGNVFTPGALAAVQWLTDAAWQVPYSSRVDSISNYQHTWAEEDDLTVEDLVSEPEALSADQLQQIRSIALNEPLLRDKLISSRGHVTIVNVTVQLPGINPIGEVPEVATKVREIKAELERLYPGISVHLSGMVMLNTSFTESSLNDNATLVPIMFGVVLVGLVLLLRSFSGTFATIIVIVGSIVATMGLAGWSGFFLSGPSASTPIMVLTLAVADCVHILSTLFHEMRQGVEKRQAIRDSLRINLQPVFLTSITTAVGFLSLNFSDSPPFRDLGNMVAAGVMIAFVLSVTLFPALLSILPLRVAPTSERKPSDLMHRLATFVIAQRRRLLPGMTLLIVALVMFLPQNRLNDDFVTYFDHSVPFRQATDYMQENISGMTTMEISLDSGESSGVNRPDFLLAVSELSDWLRAQPRTGHVNTITDTLKRLNRNMHGDDDSYYRLPQDRELAAQYLLLYEMSLPYGLDLNNQLNVDKSSTRVVVTFDNLTSTEQIEMERQVYAWLSEHAPQIKAQIASTSLMFAHIGQRNIYSMLLGTATALVLISLMLGIALRSVRYGLISLLPNLAPAAMGFGLWYLIDGQIGLALSVVAGMTLGIVVDDTVHFLSKYLYARRQRGYTSEQAVRYAFASVGRALWITTAVLVAGFMVLAQSSFKINADMGLLTAVTILIALVVDFLFLPPLLMLLDRDGQAVTTDQKGDKDAAHEPTA